jgi:hypothetical protein
MKVHGCSLGPPRLLYPISPPCSPATVRDNFHRAARVFGSPLRLPESRIPDQVSRTRVFVPGIPGQGFVPLPGMVGYGATVWNPLRILIQSVNYIPGKGTKPR